MGDQESSTIIILKEKWEWDSDIKTTSYNYIIEILTKNQEPLSVKAKITNKKTLDSYIVNIGIIEEKYIVMTCTCPHFTKKILPNATKYGSKIKIHPNLEGIFVNTNILFDKHCRIVAYYLNLI